MDNDLFPPASDTSLSDVKSQIREATEAIRNSDTTTAKRITANLMKTTSGDADVWFLYGYLVDDPTKKRQAIEKALLINPEHIRARQLLGHLQADDLMGDFPMPSSSPFAAPLPAAPPAPIIVNVHNISQSNPTVMTTVNSVVSLPAVKINQFAMIFGFVLAFFLGIFGISHLLTGKIGGAFTHFIGGIVWLITAGIIITISVGLGLFIVVPLHFYIAYRWSKKGATVAA